MTGAANLVCVVAGGLAITSGCFGDVTPRVLLDPAGDAVTRRTDLGNDGHMSPASGRPDLIRLVIGGWRPTDPGHDHYSGEWVSPVGADIFRLDLVFKGMVNPPGRLFGGEFNPLQYGPTPLYGYVEFDVDLDPDSGGELGGAAVNRYLANAGRFGGRPQGLIGTRAAVSSLDYDLDFDSAPQFERSGEDFALVLCGCSTVTIESQDGNQDGIFDPGETWLVRGRFFQRAGGYRLASTVFGGSQAGMYDPFVLLRFRHDGHPTDPTTTVTLVFPLTMHGAAILATPPGGSTPPDQSMNSMIDVGNDPFSVVEALNDVINRLAAPPIPPESTWVLAHHWLGRNPAAYLNPTMWNVNFLVGTSYDQPQEGASFVWTDVGFDHMVGNVNGDARVSVVDQTQIQEAIAAGDAGDGTMDGRVVLAGFAENFNLYDVDADGVIGPADVAFCQSRCSANWDNSTMVDSADFFAFIGDFFDGEADFDENGMTNSYDFFSFLSAFFEGC